MEKPKEESKELLRLRIAPEACLFVESAPYNPLVESYDRILAGYMKDFIRHWNNDPTKKIKCVGLAAPQIGENRRLFVMWPYWKSGSERGVRVCFNPVIKSHGREVVKEREGCLSIPGRISEKSRYAIIEVAYFNENGEYVQETLRRWEARIFQHELDHLDGILCLKTEGKMRTYASDL